ncbi:Phosphopantothenoylcysteine synthetase [Streptococcus sp. DD12]|nr:Phosphopantothenoylcysteine synthetase [Streptococcus sp. DD12]
MKILITSGGTSQPIDSVRSVTNRSTGQLGTFVARQFLKNGHEVTLVTTQTAIKPEDHPALTLVLVETVSDVQEILERLVPVHDALIHAMAISDYDPIRMVPFAEVAQADDLTPFLEKEDQIQKISSKSDVQVLFLQKHLKSFPWSRPGTLIFC